MNKLSIIAPVYNMEKYIGQFLDSIEAQTCSEFELILVDDGSSDNSPAILDNFAKNHSFCHVIHQKNSGPCAARNAGIAVATGEYLYIVDSDDWLSKNAVADILRAASDLNADVLYGQTYTEYKDKSILEQPFPDEFFSDDTLTIKEIQCALNNNNLIKCVDTPFSYISYLGGAPWRAVVRKSLLEENGVRFPEGLFLGEDILFWQRVFDHVKSVAYVKKVFYHYRIVGQSLSHGYKPNLLRIYDSVFQAQEAYLKSTHKDKFHWDAYYFRVILYIRQSISFYFKHERAEGHMYTEFVEMLRQDPYATAIRSVPISKLIKLKPKLAIIMLKLGLYRLYWWIA